MACASATYSDLLRPGLVATYARAPDRLVGRGGDDTLRGGNGADVCRGGAGTDEVLDCEDAIERASRAGSSAEGSVTGAAADAR